MKIIKEIEDQYFEIDNQYAAKEFEAHSKGHFLKEDEWRKKRDLNTHAYFLFVFTRLEDHIKTQSSSLIINKQTNITHWKTRAIWDNTDPKNIHFKKRVGLLTDKNLTDYQTIISYYDQRNKIAHGETLPDISIAINMPTVFNEVKRFFKELKK